MAQFAVYRNAHAASKDAYPLLVDIQSDLVSDLATRVVVPLAPAAEWKGKSIKRLMPTVTVQGRSYVLVVPQLAGIPAKQLGAMVGTLAAQREHIIAALDLLVTGI